jgi:hypothetical protein
MPGQSNGNPTLGNPTLYFHFASIDEAAAQLYVISRTTRNILRFSWSRNT